LRKKIHNTQKCITNKILKTLEKNIQPFVRNHNFRIVGYYLWPHAVGLLLSGVMVLNEKNEYIRRCHEGAHTLTYTLYSTVAPSLSDLGTRPSATDLATSATPAATTHTHMRTAATITLPVDVCDVTGHT